MYRLLLLDDEINILNALRRCLGASGVKNALPGSAFECFTSAARALDRLEEEDFDVILCDYRMPEMSGVEFLSRACEIQPGVCRMLMSAHADLDAVVAAINEARIARFIGKPWDDDELRAIVGQAVAARTSSLAAAPFGATRAERELETECPGITRVERDDDGGIIIPTRYLAS